MPDPALSNATAVQQHTTTYNSHAEEPADVIIAFRITRSLSDKISNYKSVYRKKSKTDAIRTLIESALYIMDKVDHLDSPEIVKYLRENLYNVQLVDDIERWPQDRIEAVIGALAGEKDRRIRLKIRKYEFH